MEPPTARPALTSKAYRTSGGGGRPIGLDRDWIAVILARVQFRADFPDPPDPWSARWPPCSREGEPDRSREPAFPQSGSLLFRRNTHRTRLRKWRRVLHPDRRQPHADHVVRGEKQIRGQRRRGERRGLVRGVADCAAERHSILTQALRNTGIIRSRADGNE